MPFDEDLKLAIDQFSDLEIDSKNTTANNAARLIAYDLCKRGDIGLEFELSDDATKREIIEQWIELIDYALNVENIRDIGLENGEQAKQPKEQRQHGRVLLRLQMRMEILVGETHYLGHTENISLSGALLMVANGSIDPIILKKEGKLWLELGKENFVEFGCEVIHVSKRGVGVRFTHEDTGKKEILQQYIDENL